MIKTHVVVTRYVPTKEFGRVITHAYGPYTLGKARKVREEMKQHGLDNGYQDQLEVTVCKMQEPEEMNR